MSNNVKKYLISSFVFSLIFLSLMLTNYSRCPSLQSCTKRSLTLVLANKKHISPKITCVLETCPLFNYILCIALNDVIVQGRSLQHYFSQTYTMAMGGEKETLCAMNHCLRFYWYDFLSRKIWPLLAKQAM